MVNQSLPVSTDLPEVARQRDSELAHQGSSKLIGPGCLSAEMRLMSDGHIALMRLLYLLTGSSVRNNVAAGGVQMNRINLECRRLLSPWHVCGRTATLH